MLGPVECNYNINTDLLLLEFPEEVAHTVLIPNLAIALTL